MPYKRSKNKYIAQIRRNGQRREKVFLKLADAKAWESEMRKLSDEEWNGTTDTVSLIDWATKYMDYAKKFSDKTYREKKSVFKRFFKSIDSATPVEELSSGMVLSYIQEQYENRSGYSANRCRKNLIAAYNWGMKYMVPKPLPAPNPCIVEKMPEVRSPRYVPPLEDFWEVYDVAEGQDKVMLLTFLHTAARRSEIFRLKISDLDFENNRIRLWTCKRAGGNKEPDWLPMTEELKRELSWWLEKRPPDLKNNPHVFLCLEKEKFHFRHYGEPFKHRAKFMKSLCKKAGVKPFGFHSVRHLSSQVLFGLGFSVGTIQALLRHQSPNTTAKYLKTLGLEHTREAVEGLSAMGHVSASGDDRKGRQECRH